MKPFHIKLIFITLAAVLIFGVGIDYMIYSLQFSYAITALVSIVSTIVYYQAFKLLKLLDKSYPRDRFLYKTITYHIMLLGLLNISNIFYALIYSLSGFVAIPQMILALVLLKEINDYMKKQKELKL